MSFIYQTQHAMKDQSSVGQVRLRRQRPKSDSEHFDSHESYIRGESLIQNINLDLNMIYLGSKGGTVVTALSFHQCGLGSTLGVDAICGLNLLLVHSFALRGFSPGTPVFPSSKFNSSKFQEPLKWMCYLYLFIYLFIYLFFNLYIYLFINRFLQVPTIVGSPASRSTSIFVTFLEQSEKPDFLCISLTFFLTHFPTL